MIFSHNDLGIAKSEDAKIFNTIRDRLCIHKNCTSKAISSHTFPENYLNNTLASRIGSKNLVFAMPAGKMYIKKPNLNKNLKSKETNHFFECSTKVAGALNLFCARHDSQLFKDIDDIPYISHNHINPVLMKSSKIIL